MAAERAMRPGPSTFRPYRAIEEMAAYMIEHDLELPVVTSNQAALAAAIDVLSEPEESTPY